MRLLTPYTDYQKTIDIAVQLSGEYENPVIFHYYWNGELNEKHLYAILSCYYFHVRENKHSIILWLENNTPNSYNTEIQKYATMRTFSFHDEKVQANILSDPLYYNRQITFYSDLVRSLLLYNYGGVWMDLDCFVLRSFEPLLRHFGNEICLYQWESQNYPNNAVYISLEPKSEKLKRIIQFIQTRNRGWGFQEAQLTYDLDIDFFVLPCSWFDPDFIRNPYNLDANHLEYTFFFKNVNQTVDFDSFFKGAFCYHWHNKWGMSIEPNSPIIQLVTILLQLCSH